MKRLTFIGGLFSLLLVLAYRMPSPPQEAAAALAAVTQQFHQDLQAFELACLAYQQGAQAYSDRQLNLEQLQQLHFDTRLAFKRIEFLAEYYDRLAVKKTLNGPPLLSVEPAVPEVSVLEPVGLQVLDELVAADIPADELAYLQDLTTKLIKSAQDLSKYQQGLRLEHRHIFEASRLELVRLFTLGLTGFDTPGTLHALPEARTSLASIAQALSAYHPLLTRHAPQLVDSLEMQFAQARKLLEETADFDRFDRLTFLRQGYNPLSKTIWDIQRTLGIETTEEVSRMPTAVNLKGASLFSADFFNTNYYSGFRPDDAQMAARQHLGKLLFYDPVLSSNLERACASCHRPERAFTDGLPTSQALDGVHHIQRNAPTLLNSVFAERYFYDLREPLLERQIKHVVLDQNEFGTDFLAIQEKLSQSATYRQYFQEAYPTAGVSSYAISNALAAYVASLTSFDSEFDRYARGEHDELAEAAKRGFNLFMGKAACGTCHFAPTFSGLVPPFYEESESEVLGVPVHPDSSYLDNDMGRIASGRPIDEAPFYAASFKTTTVRNIVLTAPYMHNGVYPDLPSVLEFYNNGGGAGLGMELAHQTLAPDSLGLVPAEIQDLIAFMESLTDTSRIGTPPQQLPVFEQHPEWNKRVVGGIY